MEKCGSEGGGAKEGCGMEKTEVKNGGERGHPLEESKGLGTGPAEM